MTLEQINKQETNRIIELIESGDVQRWKKQFDIVNSLEAIYLRVKENGEAWTISGEWLEPNSIGAGYYVNEQFKPGFYISWKQLTMLRLRIKKGSKCAGNIYKYETYYAYFAKEQKAKLDQSEEAYEIYNKLLKRGEQYKIYEKPIRLEGEEYPFYLALDFKNTLVYQLHSYVKNNLFNIEDIDQTHKPFDIIKYWHIDNKKLEQIKANETRQPEEVQASFNDVLNNYIVKYDFHLKENDHITQPAYTPVIKVIELTPQKYYKNYNDYLQVKAHELAHSTGETFKRFNNKGEAWGFRTNGYAREELIAELSTIFLFNSNHLEDNEVFKNSIAYLKSWCSHLRKGVENIPSAIVEAKKACNLINGFNIYEIIKATTGQGE